MLFVLTYTKYYSVRKMADESTVDVLERNVYVARKELNNLRREVNSLKRMFIQKIKEVKGFVERGTLSPIAAM